MNILENSLPPLSERPPAFPGGLRRISEGEAAELRMAGQENRESLARRRKPGTFHCAVPKVFWHAVCILNRKPRHIFQTLLHSLPKDRRLPRRSFSLSFSLKAAKTPPCAHGSRNHLPPVWRVLPASLNDRVLAPSCQPRRLVKFSCRQADQLSPAEDTVMAQGSSGTCSPGTCHTGAQKKPPFP